MNYLISKELRDALINYLAAKPYAEVAQPIAMLQQLELVKEREGDQKQ